MRDLILFIICSTIVIFCLNDRIYSQNNNNDSASNDNQAIKVDVDSYIDELIGEDVATTEISEILSIEEAKKKFDKLSNEEQKEVLARWDELKNLTPEQRLKAAENYRRLIELENQNATDENSDNQEVSKEPKNQFDLTTNPSNIMMNLVRIKFNGAHRSRLQQYTEFLGAIKRMEPGFFKKIYQYPEQKRGKEILSIRNQIIKTEIAFVAEKLNLDMATNQKLQKMTQKHIKQMDELQLNFINKMDKIWTDTINMIQTQTGSKIICDRSIFQNENPPRRSHIDKMNPEDLPRKPFGKHRNYPRDISVNKRDFQRIIDSLELDHESQILLWEVYNEIVELFENNKTSKNDTQSFLSEFLSRTSMFLDSKQIILVSEILNDKSRNNRSNGRNGFRSHKRIFEEKSESEKQKFPKR